MSCSVSDRQLTNVVSASGDTSFDNSSIAEYATSGWINRKNRNRPLRIQEKWWKNPEHLISCPGAPTRLGVAGINRFVWDILNVHDCTLPQCLRRSVQHRSQSTHGTRFRTHQGMKLKENCVLHRKYIPHIATAAGIHQPRFKK